MAEADIEVAASFLQDWRPDGPWVLTTIAVDKKLILTTTFTGAESAEMCAWITRQGDAKRNVYFHVNTAMRKLEKKAERTDIASVDWLHVDVDPDPGEDLDDERRRILALIQKHTGLPAPSCIVFSGGGYQAYWRLREPIKTNGDLAAAEDAARFNLQIELMLGADSCHDVSRIMRLPGTVNWPNEKKRKRGQVPTLAAVMLWKPERVYNLSEFTKAPMVQDSVPDSSSSGEPEVTVSGNVRRIVDLDAELPDGVSQRAKVAIVQGLDPDQPLKGDNSRSEWLFFVCCELVRHNTPDDDVYAIITDPGYAISASVRDKGNSGSVHRYAVRQIQRAKEHAIDPWLSTLNGKYALVESVGGRCRIAKEDYDPSMDHREVEFLLVDGFRITYGNQFIDTVVQGPKGSSVTQIPVGKWWLAHPNRRTYSGVIFYPNHTFPGKLNLWRGFACDAIPGNCGLFLSHIRDVLCKGREEDSNYLLGWMAHAVQLPHLPGYSAIVMRGRMGTGKGVFAHTFGGLFGAHYKHITNAQHLLGNFNSQLQDAVLIFADEAFNTQSRLHESSLKALITEPRINVELKGVDVVPMRNCTHNVIAGNEDWLVPARLDDRRFFIIEVDDSRRCDTNYFGAMDAQMTRGGREALLHYLLNYDLSSFDVRNPPKTEELRRQQDHSMNDLEAFWYQRLRDGRLMPDHGTWHHTTITASLVDAFLHETSSRMTQHQVASRLGKFLMGIVPNLANRRLRGQKVQWITSRNVQRTTESPWVWCFPSLAECRARWDREYGDRPWPEIEMPDEVTVKGSDGTGAF